MNGKIWTLNIEHRRLNVEHWTAYHHFIAVSKQIWRICNTCTRIFEQMYVSYLFHISTSNSFWWRWIKSTILRSHHSDASKGTCTPITSILFGWHGRSRAWDGARNCCCRPWCQHKGRYLQHDWWQNYHPDCCCVMAEGNHFSYARWIQLSSGFWPWYSSAVLLIERLFWTVVHFVCLYGWSWMMAFAWSWRLAHDSCCCDALEKGSSVRTRRCHRRWFFQKIEALPVPSYLKYVEGCLKCDDV